ncbi:MAG: diaminopimelate decarboxylase [Oscillospiraceae bacterium]
MFASNCLSVNQAGHLSIGGADSVVLARTWGTPLYVMDELSIRDAVRQYKNSIERFYEGHGQVAYAGKAFSCKEMYRIMQEEDCAVDTVSQGELFTALSVGFPSQNIYYHGNNKTPAELVYAVQHDVGRIVVDNTAELETLSSIAISQHKTVSILLRIKPGIDAHTHDFIRTGQIDSKFGFALETGEALDAARYAQTHRGLSLVGIHCHIGSQIFEIDPFVLAAQVMIGFMAEVRRETGCQLTELNLGGGFGIKYTSDHDPVPYMDYMESVSKVVHSTCDSLKVPYPFIVIEPGRSVVGPAGITLYTVGGITEIPGVRTYISIDGGMTDNPRYILYHSQYEALIANRSSEVKSSVVTIAGRNCESGDLIGEEVPIQTPHVGDTLAVLATGAYNYSMASNYNRVPRAACVMIRDGEAHLIIRRESMEDLVHNDL